MIGIADAGDSTCATCGKPLVWVPVGGNLLQATCRDRCPQAERVRVPAGTVPFDRQITHDLTLTVRGNNLFHQGWIEGVLGLPMRDLTALRPLDAETFELGYRTAVETDSMLTEAARKMVGVGQIVYER